MILAFLLMVLIILNALPCIRMERCGPVAKADSYIKYLKTEN